VNQIWYCWLSRLSSTLHKSEFSSLFNGRELYNNKITGTIPEELGNLTNLESLDLYLNNISGIIPNTLGNLKKLRFLYDILSLFLYLWSAKFIYVDFNFFLSLPLFNILFCVFSDAKWSRFCTLFNMTITLIAKLQYTKVHA
jgi:hypothetical protein